MLAQVPTDIPSGATQWIAPGSATAAIILVVIIFLKQIRYMQARFDNSLKLYNAKIEQIAKDNREQIEKMFEKMQANEERRMQQIQNLFDKVMVVSANSVQAIGELKQGFETLARKVEEKLTEKPK